MLREQRPFKVFQSACNVHERICAGSQRARAFVWPIRNKQKGDYIELVVFADDAAKIQRIYDNLGLIM